ncbi:MAG: sulfatase-like hydrolase/transferase [Planctomycetota bacterium]
MLTPALARATLLALLSTAPLALAGSTHDAPPHVVVIMVDDLGWRDLSPACWPDPKGPGARHFMTPAVERLAREGARFSEAYASAPVCTPTRTSFLTGATPARNGITYWTRFAGKDQSAKHPLLEAPEWNVDGLQPGDVTLAALLADSHRTIHVGKAHFGTSPGDEPGAGGGDPTTLGFEVNVAGWAAGGPGSYFGIDDFSAAKREERLGRKGRDRRWDVPGLEEFHGQEVYLTEALLSRAVLELEAAVEDGERVFLHFAPYAVHAPLLGHPMLASRFPDLDGPELAYATMVHAVDRVTGRLLETLDELGIADETIVVWTSDNGGLSAHARGADLRHRHNLPARSGKGSAYDGGIRVPLIVRWPGVVEPGRVVDGPVVTHDLFPTLLAATGVEVPKEHAPRVDGVDLTGVLAGREEVPGDRAILWHQPHFWGVNGPGIEPYSAVRRGRWKLIYFHSGAEVDVDTGRRSGGPRFELYDLAEDVGELRDLAFARPAVTRGMAGVLSGLLESSGASMSISKATGQPVPLPSALLEDATDR